MTTTCTVFECSDDILALGLCGKHYDRQHRNGTTDLIRVSNAGKTCSVDGCSEPVVGGGLCRPHYLPAWRAARKAERIAADTRVCTVCDGPLAGKPSDAIYCSRTCKEAKRKEDGRANAASMRSYFKSRYGLTVEQIEEMATTGCAICHTTDWRGRHGKPNVDHCHATGRVRGILCSECNYGLGKFRDDPALLQSAIDYLAAAQGLVIAK